MKRHLYYILLASACFLIQGCSEENPIETEQYMKQVYLVGIAEEGGMVSREINFSEDEVETFVAVAASGSQNPNEDIHVSIEEYDEAIDNYNRKFRSGTDVQYQKLPVGFYTIPSMEGTIKSNESYVRLPIKISPEGLHCDSLYAIPLRMKSCDKYQIARQDTAVLVAIKTINQYSENYVYAGTTTNLDNQSSSSFNLVRNAIAVDKNTIRIYHSGSEKLENVDNAGLKITVNADKSLHFEGWKNLQVISEHGAYDPETSTFSFEIEYKTGNEVIYKTTATLVSSSSIPVN